MPYIMYVVLQGDDTLLRFTMDPRTGKLTLQEKMKVPGEPAPVAVDPGCRFLYVGRRSSCIISSFQIMPQTGKLNPIGEVQTASDPCYMATDRSGKFLFSAYLKAGKTAVHPISVDGVAYGPPVEWRETAPGAHCIQTDPSNRFAFVPHIAGIGANAIFLFHFDAKTGRLTPNSSSYLVPERLDGPRHFCFHPIKNILYFSNEQGCSVTSYTLDTATGLLTLLQTVSTLPEGYSGPNTCSKIQIVPSGKFLYVPNRGHHSIACFAVDATTGLLTPRGHMPTETVPRAFCLDPTGTFLYAAGLESGRLASYRINDSTGSLKPLEVYPVGTRPRWVMIVRLE